MIHEKRVEKCEYSIIRLQSESLLCDMVWRKMAKNTAAPPRLADSPAPTEGMARFIFCRTKMHKCRTQKKSSEDCNAANNHIE